MSDSSHLHAAFEHVPCYISPEEISAATPRSVEELASLLEDAAFTISELEDDAVQQDLATTTRCTKCKRQVSRHGGCACDSGVPTCDAADPGVVHP